MYSADAIRALDHQWVMGTYRRQEPLFVRGEGAYVYDSEGNAYLDLVAGVAVCSVGHCHPKLVRRICEQAGTLMHLSNLYLTAPQAELAKKLCALSGMESVFFVNTGAEACETGLKVARKYARNCKGSDAYEIIALEGSFHGRTMGAVSATGQPQYQEPFAPLVPGFRHVPRNDSDALKQAFSERTAAVMMEPIQGESGIHPLSHEFLKTARDLCDQYGALLIFDEVQTGMGRTGEWFAWQHDHIQPDLMALAKGLGGGFPIGALLARGKAAKTLVPGDHGSTFGGNALAATAAMTVIEIIEEEGLRQNAEAIGNYFRALLCALKDQGCPIQEVRGRGLMIGVGLSQPVARETAKHALKKGLLVNPVGDHTLRIVPPLILNESQVNQAVAILSEVWKNEFN
ncbi:MAG: acetylornithine transaminase [Fimbriimonadia bacterium]|nr:acetylornithine transaminase [Fimbriimonadia bacterium]